MWREGGKTHPSIVLTDVLAEICMSASARGRPGERGESGRMRAKAREAPARTGRPEERRARVAPRHRHDGRHGQVLDKRTRNDNLERQPLARLHGRDDVLKLLRRVRLVETRKVHLGLQVRQREHLNLASPRRIRLAIVLRQRRRVEVGRAKDVGRLPALAANASGVQRLLERNVHVHVLLLVVHQNVHVRRRQRLLCVPHRRRRHPVKLAHLRRALQHLHRILVVRHLVRHRREHAHAAEGARLKALHTRLKRRRRRRTTLLVRNLLLRRRRHVEEELGRNDQHVWRHLVARHARLGLLHALVKTKALLLRNGVEHHLVSHRRAHRAARAQALLHVVPEVVVAAREVGKDAVKVTCFLHAVPDRRELVREVRTARLRRVEVALDHHANATPDDAVTMPASQAGLHPAHALIRNPLKQSDVKTELVPLHRGPRNADKRQRHVGLPVLG